MNVKIKCAIAFLLGTGVGVGASFKFFKDYFRKISNEEIASIDEYWKNKQGKEEETEVANEPTENDIPDRLPGPDVIVRNPYNEAMAKYNDFVDYNATHPISYTNEEDESYEEDPRILYPDISEFGEKENYDIVEFTYYAGDKTIVDENGDPMNSDEVMNSVGLEVLTSFEQYMIDNVVRVCNERFETYYIIAYDEDSYFETRF